MRARAAAASDATRVRVGLRVRGTVQGVGFRPSVYRLAAAAGLDGFVRNDSQGVWIELEGDPAEVGSFAARLRAEAPPLARIDEIEATDLPRAAGRGFTVAVSERASDAGAGVPSDAATCVECLRELFDPADRRHRYPFINCTDCGPRYTIVRELPYDRATTTMSAFELCDACRDEYEDPASRRFHAEPNACPECGPRLEFALGGAASRRTGEAALAAAVEELVTGRIVAVKGLGGFFLACDATRESTVAELRKRKRRPDKPFALMARDLATARKVALLGDEAVGALLSPGAPIVLAPALPRTNVAPSVAPGLGEHGVMLPYTPLHHLLLADGPPLLVMTSGNLSEEPIARDDAHALAKLSGVADAFLLHDRAIHTRVDDSVLRVAAGDVRPVRRSRGYVPEPISIGFEGPPVLAVGAELKNTVCLTRRGAAYLSPHVGNLSNLEAFAFFEEVIGKLSRLLEVRPEVVAHDLHPDYLSTRWAIRSGLPRVGVQHHHAHVAACLTEHGRTESTIGVAFDGTGCGPAGEIWGGEILLADLGGFSRVGFLRPIALAGGEAAIRQPWRLGAAALLDSGESLEILPGVDANRREAVRRLLEKGIASPRATGAGRWFDAVAAILGVRTEITYEGQAAVELEAAAAPGDAEPCDFGFLPSAEGAFEIDLRPAVKAIVAARRAGVSVGELSARFHETLAAAVAAGCRRARERSGVSLVVLSGGCFQNRRLTDRTAALLDSAGFEVLLHRRVPPNDGGVALGQAAVAEWRTRKGTT